MTERNSVLNGSGERVSLQQVHAVVRHVPVVFDQLQFGDVRRAEGAAAQALQDGGQVGRSCSGRQKRTAVMCAALMR